MRYDGVCSSRDGEEVSLVSSQQQLQHHHCLTLLQIHSSARPFIQGLLATPPAAPEAVQLICKEVQQQPVVSRVGMDGWWTSTVGTAATNFLCTFYCFTRHAAQSPTSPIYLLFALRIHSCVAMSAIVLCFEGGRCRN